MQTGGRGIEYRVLIEERQKDFILLGLGVLSVKGTGDIVSVRRSKNDSVDQRVNLRVVWT